MRLSVDILPLVTQLVTLLIGSRPNSSPVDMCRKRIWERNPYEALRQTETTQQTENQIVNQAAQTEVVGNANEDFNLVQNNPNIGTDERIGPLENLIALTFTLIFGSTFLFFYLQILWEITYLFLKFISRHD